MNIKKRAILQWVKSTNGGRINPPNGPVYSTVAKFPHSKIDWLKEAWSLIIEFIDSPDASLTHRVWVYFLADNPPDLLQNNSFFELYEGRQLVAKGKIIENWME